MTWKLEEKNTVAYLDLCLRAVEDDKVFSQFRNMDPMTMIVENSPEKSGYEYFDIIYRTYHWLLDHFDNFCTSDSIGSPMQIPFGLREISPSTLRYIKTLGDLHLHFGPLSGMTIAEIGGGYGGLCKIIHDVYKPSDYHLFDLPEPLALQKKFLSHFGVTPVTSEYPEQIDLLIAMYSWSELSEDLQVEYLDKVISKAKNCYIMLNYDMERSYQLLKDAFPSAEIKEYHIFGDDTMTDYAPYDRYIIIKN